MVTLHEDLPADGTLTMDTLQRAVGMMESRAQQSGCALSALPVMVTIEEGGSTLRVSKQYREVNS